MKLNPIESLCDLNDHLAHATEIKLFNTGTWYKMNSPLFYLTMHVHEKLYQINMHFVCTRRLHDECFSEQLWGEMW